MHGFKIGLKISLRSGMSLRSKYLKIIYFFQQRIGTMQEAVIYVIFGEIMITSLDS